MNWQHISDLLQGEMSSGIIGTAVARLVLAALLGGLIGLERELKRRPAGLRTNMFLCLGAAMFTLLSIYLAQVPGEQTRIAAQVISGIGFIGAGTILHNRGLTTGLTTAATLFVVASVGMAAGGGLYLTAIFATGVVLLSLFTLGRLEQLFNLKSGLTGYEVTGPEESQVIREVNEILEPTHRVMENVIVAATHKHTRVQFTVEGTRGEQERLLGKLKQSKLLASVENLGPLERD
jgi:putative Mg2+ transporter-C (MgtC) family protein